jgi:virulence-associated protein VagC
VKRGEDVKRFKIVGGGELALPKEFEKRWETHTVSIEDLGDHLVVHPVLEVTEQTDDEWVDVEKKIPGATRRTGGPTGY